MFLMKRAIRAALILLAAPAVLAQVPGEVTGLLIDDTSTLSWTAASGADDYNVYRGILSRVADVAPRCHGDEIVPTSFASPDDPDPGAGFYYLVTAEAAGGEGTPGQPTTGGDRDLLGSCDTVMRNHVLARVTYGWDEWSRDRAAALGLQPFIDEQLDPASIDESTNTELSSRTASLDPPDTIQELQGLDLVNAVYARRQLEQHAAMFWTNHFNTDYRTSNQFFQVYSDLVRRRFEATKLHHDEVEKFRDRAFNGTFRDIVEASALSPAMILYLDTDNNVAGTPNENYARELLELYTCGVDRCYDQQDIEELARVFTGWNVCKKQGGIPDDYLGACIPGALIGTDFEPTGLWVANFRVNQHDCGAKTLFHGQPEETIVPDTCGNTVDGLNDVFLALDAIVAHPETPRYIAEKLLIRFVAEDFSQTMVDNVLAVWNDAGNPQGVGDLREVMREVLAQSELLSPDSTGNKIRTPFEHMAAAFRGVRGQTNGTSTVRNYLIELQELLHQNPVPTGFSEIGDDWIDTNNTLTRQNFGLDMTGRTSTNFGADITGLLADNGVSTAQGNADGIVDFFADALYGGALTAAERQKAIDYLNTDDNGVVSNYNDDRIRETVGFMLGFAQFQEQ